MHVRSNFRENGFSVYWSLSEYVTYLNLIFAKNTANRLILLTYDLRIGIALDAPEYTKQGKE